MIEFAGWTSLAMAAASLLAALYYQYKAYANLAGNPEEARRAAFRRGPFASRQFFTDAGWRYWTRSFQLAALTALLMVAGGVLIARS